MTAVPSRPAQPTTCTTQIAGDVTAAGDPVMIAFDQVADPGRTFRLSAIVDAFRDALRVLVEHGEVSAGSCMALAAQYRTLRVRALRELSSGSLDQDEAELIPDLDVAVSDVGVVYAATVALGRWIDSAFNTPVFLANRAAQERAVLKSVADGHALPGPREPGSAAAPGAYL